jgi:hypothetical protein
MAVTVPSYSSQVGILSTVLLGGLTVAFATFVRKLYNARMPFRKLMRQGLVSHRAATP